MLTRNLAVLFTDLSGFTQATSTMSRVQMESFLSRHETLLRPILLQGKGKIIKTIGDSFLAVFDSATDAVLAAVEIQNGAEDHNRKNPREKMEVRVAINVGEVTERDGDVYGEAVNVASRLLSACEKNQICLTEAVYLVMNRNEVATRDLGYHEFKGVPRKVRVYRVLRQGELASRRFPLLSVPRIRITTLLLSVFLLASVLLAAFARIFFSEAKPEASRVVQAKPSPSPTGRARPVVPQPAKTENAPEISPAPPESQEAHAPAPQPTPLPTRREARKAPKPKPPDASPAREEPKPASELSPPAEPPQNPTPTQEPVAVSRDEAITHHWDEVKEYVSGSETVAACTNGNCSNLKVDIERGILKTLYFSSGETLGFSAELSEKGTAAETDAQGNVWEFYLDLSSPVVGMAVEAWASAKGYVIR